MRKIDTIVWHTAASGDEAAGTHFDASADQIDDWHKDRGWDGIGYHYVVRWDGTVERGRTLSAIGAHAKPYNRNSIGICFSGHGDIARHSPLQEAAGVALTRALMDAFGVPAVRVVGHGELVEGRTCPSSCVSMDAVRRELSRKPVITR